MPHSLRGTNTLPLKWMSSGLFWSGLCLSGSLSLSLLLSSSVSLASLPSSPSFFPPPHTSHLSPSTAFSPSYSLLLLSFYFTSLPLSLFSLFSFSPLTCSPVSPSRYISQLHFVLSAIHPIPSFHYTHKAAISLTPITTKPSSLPSSSLSVSLPSSTTHILSLSLPLSLDNTHTPSLSQFQIHTLLLPLLPLPPISSLTSSVYCRSSISFPPLFPSLFIPAVYSNKDSHLVNG